MLVGPGVFKSRGRFLAWSLATKLTRHHPFSGMLADCWSGSQALLCQSICSTGLFLRRGWCWLWRALFEKYPQLQRFRGFSDGQVSKFGCSLPSLGSGSTPGVSTHFLSSWTLCFLRLDYLFRCQSAQEVIVSRALIVWSALVGVRFH